MPYVKKAAAVKIAFPSDKHYFVMWRDKVPYGALREARSRAVIVRVNPDTNEATPEFDTIAYNDYALLAHIESWNLDDVDGQSLPLTIESLAQLDSDDVAVLNERMAGVAQSQEKERKNS